MNPQVVVNSLAVKKNKEANFNFVKYDIEVSIEEIENKDKEMPECTMWRSMANLGL